MQRRAPTSGLHLSPVVRKRKAQQGCALPCWVLLVSLRNSTRGCVALSWGVISCMGLTEHLGLDNKRETSGPASVEELLCGSRSPRGMLSAAAGRCVPSTQLCWDPGTALLLAAGYAIFMHPSAREHPNALSAWRCGALLGYFPAWVSFPLALSSGQVWSAIWRWKQAPWMVAVSPHPVLPPAFASPRDARGGHQRWISLCHLPLQAH